MWQREHGKSTARNAAADHGTLAGQHFDLAKRKEGLLKAAFLGFEGFDAEVFDTGGIQNDALGLSSETGERDEKEEIKAHEHQSSTPAFFSKVMVKK
jgi:hypothetical protein